MRKKAADGLRCMANYVLEAERDPRRALVLLDRSLVMCFTPRAAFLKADVLVDLGEPQAALASYNAGLAAQALPEAMYNEALLLHEMARYDEALAMLIDCEQAMNNSEPDTGIVTEKALVLMHQGNHDDALHVLEPLLAPHSIDTCAMSVAMRVLLDAARATDAIVPAQRIVDVLSVPAPSTLESHELYMLANALRVMGREDDAQAMYRRTLKSLLSGSAGASDLAKVHFRLGYHEQAAALATTAIAERPWHPKALVVKSRSFAAMGKTAEAITAAELAATQRPGHPKTLSLLASLRGIVN